MAEETSNNSTKRLVKILVIVGIGIPVLVELMTLFNLINVQIFDDEKSDEQASAKVEEVRGVSEGDTLFKGQPTPIIIDRLRIKVDAQDWRFEIGLRALDSLTQDELQVKVDSLQLQSEEMLLGDQNRFWQIQNQRPLNILAEWELPNGDIPQKLFISAVQVNGENGRRHEVVPLDKIPVRYNQQ
ncbi:hypothetical protein [Fodinibius sp. Rm-B-1B1-1]|uniref:hypothetical protein n=1 Tax=Fodinibius alkaliphilus TaxID=3140241 RepID=UPI00315A5C83